MPVEARPKRPKYAEIRAKLIEKGYTIRSFAHANSYPPTSVYSAARGDRHGVQATKIFNHIMQFAYAQ